MQHSQWMKWIISFSYILGMILVCLILSIWQIVYSLARGISHSLCLSASLYSRFVENVRSVFSFFSISITMLLNQALILMLHRLCFVDFRFFVSNSFLGFPFSCEKKFPQNSIGSNECAKAKRFRFIIIFRWSIFGMYKQKGSDLRYMPELLVAAAVAAFTGTAVFMWSDRYYQIRKTGNECFLETFTKFKWNEFVIWTRC